VSELQTVDRLKNMEHWRMILTAKREIKYSVKNKSQGHFAHRNLIRTTMGLKVRLKLRFCHYIIIIIML
jgi:hypothetical protein